MRARPQYSRYERVMPRRTDADAVSCMYAVHALVLEPYRYRNSCIWSVLPSCVLTLLNSPFSVRSLLSRDSLTDDAASSIRSSL